MTWYLLILSAVSALMLWRDLGSGRIYTFFANYSSRRWQWELFFEKSLDYNAPEFFIERYNAPILYWTIIGFVSVGCLSAFGLTIISFFVSEQELDAHRPMKYLFFATTTVLFLYLVIGVQARALSWIKNYGSVDKKW